ncbi:MAG: N4-gp56 family major capsid protein [Deltaproteobacteria bacterium]|nr:N4-gp56 family major capsid protein [Deltaproteobacteria bacterium]
MAMQTFALNAGRLNKYKGQILSHAVPMEVLGKAGRQVRFPKNNSDTYVARRFLPYNTSSTNANTQNQFFTAGTGNRDVTIVQAHQTQEGVTSTPTSITPMDVTVVMAQYDCLYGFTDKTYDLYEDDIPKEMITQVGERVTFVNEMIIYGALRACTNQYYGGTGTTVATVNGGLTLGFVRKISKNLQANHGKPVNSVLKASGAYGTDAVAAGFTVYCHTDLEPDIRDIPNFTPAEKYASGTPMPGEIGKVERFRFITSPDLPAVQDGGAAVGATGLYSTSGSNIDVYTLIVTAQDAWSQVAVRGKDALDPTYLPPGQKSKSDPHGQRGYAGTIWWKAVMIENNGWMAIGSVGSKTLS